MGLLEGITDAVRDVSGELQLELAVTGTSADPSFSGTVNVTNGAFVVAATGARYDSGLAFLRLDRDRLTVDRFHLEDRNRQPLDVSGSLGVRALQIGDLEIDVKANRFEVLRNGFGRIDADVALNVRGQIDRPRITGRVSVVDGEVSVDTILDRALFQPYSTEVATPTSAATLFDPWNRLGLDIHLNVPGSLRMTGDDVQVRPGTPLGMGRFNLRAIGDLYLY